MVDFHLHTSWTDGQHSVHNMYAEACRRGLKALLFSEHARKDSIAWFPDFAAEVQALPNSPCAAFVGAEVRICDYEGQLDLTADLLSHIDLLVASVHRFPEDSGRDFSPMSATEALHKEYMLSMAALENPVVDILGHPFGMSLNRYQAQPFPTQMDELVRKAKKHGVAIEINKKYHAQYPQIVTVCQKHGVAVSWGSDAHCVSELLFPADKNKFLGAR